MAGEFWSWSPRKLRNIGLKIGQANGEENSGSQFMFLKKKQKKTPTSFPCPINLHLVKEPLHIKFHNFNILFNESYAIFPLNASEYSMSLGLFNSTLYALE